MILIILTLPDVFGDGTWIKISDVSGETSNNNIINTVDSDQLLGIANSSFILDENYSSVELVVTSLGNWRVSIG